MGIDCFCLRIGRTRRQLADGETLDRKNQAEDELKAFGALTFENQYKEKRPHPLVNIIRDCNVLMARLRRELNLSEVQSPSRPPKLKYGGKQYGRT